MSQISLKAMLELVDKATAPLKDIMGSSEKPSPENIVGTDAPTQAEATVENLATIPSEHRALYRQLRQYKLDVSYDDPRLHFWEKKSRSVIAYAASASNRLNINKWQWHTPEQILPEELLRT